MFADWSACLSSIDVDRAPERQVRAWLGAAAQHQAALDAFIAKCAARLGDASAVRGATRCTQREADQAVARGEALAALPAVAEALSRNCPLEKPRRRMRERSQKETMVLV